MKKRSVKEKKKPTDFEIIQIVIAAIITIFYSWIILNNSSQLIEMNDTLYFLLFLVIIPLLVFLFFYAIKKNYIAKGIMLGMLIVIISVLIFLGACYLMLKP